MNRVLIVVIAVITTPLLALARSFDDDVRSINANSKDAASSMSRLQKGGQDAISAMIKGLGGLDPDKKIQLLRSVSDIMREHKALKERDSDASELARQARLETSDRSLRGHMVLAMRDFRSPTAVQELERFATDDSEERIREIATEAVGRISKNEAPFFRKQTKDGSRKVQMAAWVALTRLGDKSGRDFARQTLKESSDFRERGYAVWILGEIANPEDAPLIKQIADSPTEHYSSKEQAIEAQKSMQLYQLQPSGQLSFLIKSLDDTSGDVRLWAYQKLAQWPDPTTTARLKIYMAEPGHKGYKEAADAVSAR